MSEFRFSRATKLAELFPPSSAGPQLTLSELESTVLLTHPALGPGSRALEWRSFSIVGAVGDPNGAVTSVIPQDRIMYVFHASCFHTAAAASDLVWETVENGTGFNVHIQSTRDIRMGPPNPQPPNTENTLARPIVVPPNHQLRCAFIGVIGAGQVTLRATVFVAGLADVPPPPF